MTPGLRFYHVVLHLGLIKFSQDLCEIKLLLLLELEGHGVHEVPVDQVEDLLQCCDLNLYLSALVLNAFFELFLLGIAFEESLEVVP